MGSGFCVGVGGETELFGASGFATCVRGDEEVEHANLRSHLYFQLCVSY